MSIINTPLDLIFKDLFFNLNNLIPDCNVYLKLEGFHIAGSIKIKSALFMVEALERQGKLVPGKSTIVESSSGNLGVALSLIARLRNYRFICISDPNIMNINKRRIEAHGGEVVIVSAPDKNDGYLTGRINYIKELLERHSDYVWINQYANFANKTAHASWTAEEILCEFPQVDHLFVGSGTTGTLMGISERFSEKSPNTRIWAVEPEGSITFDPTRSKKRKIPGIGTSRKPELADRTKVHEILYVEESDTIKTCYKIERKYGLLLGGSSGSVISAIRSAATSFKKGEQIVAISPDNGDNYIETIYSPEWVKQHYGFDPVEDQSAVGAITEPSMKSLSEIIGS